MRVQIRSFIKGGNHGQYLQAMGLASLIGEVAPSALVFHADYHNHFRKELAAHVRGGTLPKFLAMQYFWLRNIQIASPVSDSDVSIYGSDMIWHLESELFPRDPVMFGSGDFSVHKLAYGPSVGYRGKNEPNWVGTLLREFDAIAVRDNNTAEFVKNHSDLEPEIVIDPCFYIPKIAPEFSSAVGERQKFIAVYSPMTSKLVTEFERNRNVRKLFGRSLNYKYIGYFPRRRFFNDLRQQLADPLLAIKQIANSKLLLTSTFHGVMMALMTNTPFIVVSSRNLAARLDSPVAGFFSGSRIVDRTELESRDVDWLNNIVSGGDIDVNGIDLYKLRSKNWLKERLNS